MAKTTRQSMTDDQAKQLVSRLLNISHLIPDTSLERLVGVLTAEMRRRGLLQTTSDDDEDQVPF